ncbi:protein of unknown function [Ralstonia solanacearum CFBP2957]|nr:protein of unknown function [Ralstonia solanacearum CFBP2957]
MHCATCKKPLATLGDEAAREVWVSPAKLAIQRAIVSAVRSGIFRIDGLKVPLPLAFMLWIKDNRDVVKECISRGAHRPENERLKFIMRELIESYCIQRGSRKSLEELLHRRKRWMKKKRTCRAEACYEDFISRQAARQSGHEDGEPAGKPTQST